MNSKFSAVLYIFFATLLLLDCSSAEKKSPAVDAVIISGNIVSVENFSSGINADRKKQTVLKKPADYKTVKPEIVSFMNSDIKVTLYAKKFAQGNGVYAEIENQGGGTGPAGLTVAYRTIKVPVTGTSWGFRSLWGIDPEEKPGSAPVVINYIVNGKEMTLMSEIMIRDVDYPVSKSMLNVGKFSDKDYTSDPKFKDLITECSALRSKAFSSVTEDSIDSILSHPRDIHKITGDFWRKRIYLAYKKNKKNNKLIKEGKTRFHRGLDLNGVIGSPVFAMADGLVVLSHKMFFEGNMVVIDHGNQVFSYYQHMDSLKVREGEKVNAGDFLGGVGATGMVTGPHLHVAFSIRGVHVDPLSILSLPVSR